MANRDHSRIWISGITLRALTLALAAAIGVTVVATYPAAAQTHKVLHNFTNGQDGSDPSAGLTMDKAGNLYGTTFGVAGGNGGVFKLKHVGSSRLFSSLYNFAGGSDGSAPYSPVAIGSDGSLYGTTYQAGEGTCANGNGCGTVFNLKPPLRVCKSTVCPWNESVIYRFTGGSDGGNPQGPLVFDKSVNLYGAARDGGTPGCNPPNVGCGTVYELTKSGNSWTQSVLYSFTGGSNDQGCPTAA